MNNELIQIKVFKIRDIETGLFSTGGTSPRWTKRGKSWSQINHVKNHLRQFCWSPKDEAGHTNYKVVKNYIPKNWEVIELSNAAPIQHTYLAHTLYPILFDNK